MLSAGRIDLLAYGKKTAFWNFREAGFSPDDFEVVYINKTYDAYFALNRETDDKIITQLQTALDKVKASGRLKILTKKYLPGF